MSHHDCLQILNGSAFARTESGSRSIAESAFKRFLACKELEKKEAGMHLVYQRTTLAVHRFGAMQEPPDNWQGRVDDNA